MSKNQLLSCNFTLDFQVVLLLDSQTKFFANSSLESEHLKRGIICILSNQTIPPLFKMMTSLNPSKISCNI